eukprot:EG_transcript_19717
MDERRPVVIGRDFASGQRWVRCSRCGLERPSPESDVPFTELGCRGGLNPFHQFGRNGPSELCAAIQRADHAAVQQLLLAKRANPNYAPGPQYDTAMHCVARSGDLRMLKLLVDSGRPLDMHATNAAGRMPWVVAFMGGHREMAERMFHLDLDMYDAFFNTPVHWASYYSDKEMVNFLLCFNRRLLPNNGKETALDIARREGHWGVVDVFLPHLPKAQRHRLSINNEDVDLAAESSEEESDGVPAETEESYVTAHLPPTGPVNRLVAPFNPIPRGRRGPVVTGPWDGPEACMVEIDLDP